MPPEQGARGQGAGGGEAGVREARFPEEIGAGGRCHRGHLRRREKSLWDLEVQLFVAEACEGKSGFGELQKDCEVRRKRPDAAPSCFRSRGQGRLLRVLEMGSFYLPLLLAQYIFLWSFRAPMKRLVPRGSLPPSSRQESGATEPLALALPHPQARCESQRIQLQSELTLQLEQRVSERLAQAQESSLQHEASLREHHRCPALSGSSRVPPAHRLPPGCPQAQVPSARRRAAPLLPLPGPLPVSPLPYQ